MSPPREEDASTRYTCAASVSTFPLDVCGLAIETPSRDEGHFLEAESAFLGGRLILVNNIPVLENAAIAQKINSNHAISVCTASLLPTSRRPETAKGLSKNGG